MKFIIYDQTLDPVNKTDFFFILKRQEPCDRPPYYIKFAMSASRADAEEMVILLNKGFVSVSDEELDLLVDIANGATKNART